MENDRPSPQGAEAALIKRVKDEIEADLDHWEPDFKRMKANRRFARGYQWPGTSAKELQDPERRYVANVTARHLKQSTSSIYARNPKFVWRRSQRLYYKLWDGTAATLQQALMTVTAPVDPMNPQPQLMAKALLTEAATFAEEQRVYEKTGETLAIIYEYFIREQTLRFKAMAKRMVLQAKTCGVGYVKQTWQRKMGHAPETERQIADARSQLDAATRIMQELSEGKIEAEDAEVARLQALLTSLEGAEMVLLREGLVFDWPDPLNIIPARHMSFIQGFVGCEWVTERHYLSPERVKEIYGVDLGGKFVPHRPEDPSSPVRPKTANYMRGTGSPEDDDMACVYVQWHRGDGLLYTLCDGYDGWLRPPSPPEVFTERFYPWFPYAPNALDSPDSPFPPSDVELMDTQQMEVNRSGEALRTHRWAARPGHAVPASMSIEDRRAAANRLPHDIVGLEGLQPDGDVKKFLQPFPTAPIDPNLYDTSPAFMDIMRSVGTQQAQLGPTAGATATEASIAEASRGTTDDSAIDELDDLLTEMAGPGGQILLANLTQQTAIEIAGPGAYWPAMNREQIAKELYLEVEAGSSGRKNQASEIQVRTQMYPLMMQVPGLSPEWALKDMLKIMDPRINYEDAIDKTALSIIALNGQAQGAANRGAPAPGPDGTDDPAAQGGEGASNAPTPEPGGAPFPKPAAPEPGPLQ